MSHQSERPQRDSLVERAARKAGAIGDLPPLNEAEVIGAASSRPMRHGSPSVETAAPPPPPIAETRRSREVQVDFSRLAAAGFITPDGPRTKITEEFRLIKRTVLARRSQSTLPNANLILVTSSAPQDGKTFVSLNLALSLASERDLRVLLIDADLPKPSIPSTLGIEAERGLIDVLTDDGVDMADVLLRTNIDGLTVLPGGRQHALSTEILASQRMARFVDEVARRYGDRIVIFDSPPVLATSEPSVLAQHVGQVVFVVRSETTDVTAVRAALDILGNAPVGFVFNASRRQFGTAQFGYYRNKGYYYYGN
jgi:exopolysaccharide/PEP-CTERM locus tyrosine autokinase